MLAAVFSRSVSDEMDRASICVGEAEESATDVASAAEALSREIDSPNGQVAEFLIDVRAA